MLAFLLTLTAWVYRCKSSISFDAFFFFVVVVVFKACIFPFNSDRSLTSVSLWAAVHVSLLVKADLCAGFPLSDRLRNSVIWEGLSVEAAAPP